MSNLRGSLRPVPTRSGMVAHIRSIYEARLRKDLDTVLAACHPDISMRIVGNPSASPFFGTRVGRHGVRCLLEAIDGAFDIFDFMIEDILVDGESVAVRCWLRLRTVETGQVMEHDTFDHIRLSGGLILEYTHFLDTGGAMAAQPPR